MNRTWCPRPDGIMVKKKKAGDLTDSGCSLASTGPGFELFPSSGYEGPA